MWDNLNILSTADGNVYIMLTLQGLPGEIFKVKPIGSSDIMSVSCGLKKSLLLRNDEE